MVRGIIEAVELSFMVPERRTNEERGSQRRRSEATISLDKLTRSERNHRVNEGKILALKVVDVSEHLGLGVVGAVRTKREKSKVIAGRVEDRTSAKDEGTNLKTG